MSKIKNIIFDWGNVLIDVTMERFNESCKEAGIVFTEKEVNSTHKDGFFLEYEKGIISDVEFRKELNLRAKANISDEKIDYIWNTMLGSVPLKKLELLNSLKEKFDLYLLSNTNSIHWNTYSKKVFSYKGLNVNDFFKKVYLSYELHVLKPDTSIFEKAVVDAGINIDETLYIDDSLINCEAAKSLGMKVIHYIPGTDLGDYFLNLN